MSTLVATMSYPVITCVKAVSFRAGLGNHVANCKETAELADIMNYENDAVEARIQKELAYSPWAASELFRDLKRFLWVSTIVDGPIAPPPAIDDAWHVFLLFTQDYAAFCNCFFGRFLHHRPRRPGDLPDGGKAVRGMIGAIRMHLGGFESLSANWQFTGMKSADCFGGSCSSELGLLLPINKLPELNSNV